MLERKRMYILDYLSFIYEQKSKCKQLAKYFRGQANYNWDLKPSVFRNNYNGFENHFYHKIQISYPNEFKNLGHLDKLAKMQHFGCPTRLLDVTSNPIVALWFACQSCIEFGKETDGILYCFHCPYGEPRGPESDRAMMLSALAYFSQQEQTDILNASFSAFKKDGTYKSKILEKFFYEITKERPTFKRILKRNDLIKNIFVQPSFSNPRIQRQEGAFLVFGGNFPPKINQSDIETIRIPAEKKLHILDELGVLGITKDFLFSNLEAAASFLKDNTTKMIKDLANIRK